MSDDHEDEPPLLEPESWERRRRARRDEVLASDTRTGDEISADYQALDRTLHLLSERVETTTPTTTRRRVFHESPRPPEPVAKPSGPTDDEVAQRIERLYEDIVWLFAVNDGEGALISLERMLMLGEPIGDAKEFVNTNRDKLLLLYEDYMGPFDRVALLGEVNAHVEMPAGFLSSHPLADTLALVDGKLTISQILERVDLPPLVGCAALKQLERSLVIDFV